MMHILDELQFSDEKPAVLQVKNTDALQVIAIGLKKNQVLKRHVTTIPAMLLVLKGKIAFEIEGDVITIDTFNTYDIPPNVPHEVTATEESVFMLVKEKSR